MQSKNQLIIDIQKLLNTHNGISPTSINPDLLEFMDEKTLIEIIGNLLDQKEQIKEPDTEWLEQFKTK